MMMAILLFIRRPLLKAKEVIAFKTFFALQKASTIIKLVLDILVGPLMVEKQIRMLTPIST